MESSIKNTVNHSSKSSVINEDATVTKLEVSAYKIPTDATEADGTAKWNSTTLILVQIKAGGKTGIGYSYATVATAFFINTELKELIIGKNAFDIPGINLFLTQQIRNSGTCGITMMAISV